MNPACIDNVVMYRIEREIIIWICLQKFKDVQDLVYVPDLWMG